MIRSIINNFDIIASELNINGFFLDNEEEFIITYRNSCNWCITFSVERYSREDLRVVIEDKSCANSHINCRYTVFILMEVLSKKIDISNLSYEIKDQVSFLMMNKDAVFVSPQPYRLEYDESAWNKVET